MAYWIFYKSNSVIVYESKQKNGPICKERLMADILRIQFNN